MPNKQTLIPFIVERCTAYLVSAPGLWRLVLYNWIEFRYELIRVKRWW